ncbi:MAG: hypothetical protein ABTQ31_07680, partial [Rhizobiaceae bacterium]
RPRRSKAKLLFGFACRHYAAKECYQTDKVIYRHAFNGHADGSDRRRLCETMVGAPRVRRERLRRR